MNCRGDLKAGLGHFENEPLRMLLWATETAEWLCFLERIPFWKERRVSVPGEV